MDRMYRDPVESLSAECARLRADLERLRADAEVARRITAPQRTIWSVAAAGAIASSIAVCLMVVLADERAHAELRACRGDVDSLEHAVDGDRREYMDLHARFSGTRETLEACQDDLADALKGVHGECQLGDPLCAPASVNRRAMR